MKIAVASMALIVTISAALVAAATAGAGRGQAALPPGAVKVADGTYYLGKKKVDGVELEGYAFVHRRKAAKPPGTPGGGGGGGSCYTLLASGAKWKTHEPFLVDAGSAPSSVGSGMTSRMNTDVGTWETAAGADVFGNGTQSNSYSANLNAVDGVNGAEFAPIADAGVIAVTYTWGIFGGPPKDRALVEWDMLFDSDSFTWATNGASNAMDFDNIATHELGHALGLGHPASTCTEETMYAYADFGETKKRDLNTGDIAGINVLY